MNTNDTKTTRIIPVADGAAAAGANDKPTPIKVWLVDDNDDHRTLLAELLAKHGGIACQRNFRSPDAAVSALASKAGPDALLLDIEMGHQNGLDAIAPIKTLARSTRVLMLTTLYDSNHHSRALEEGASGFLLKRYGLDRIVEQIRKPEPVDPAQARRRRKRACAAQSGRHEPAPEAKPGRSKWWCRFSRLNRLIG